ncbi:uncharacterized protein LOC128211084 isoform X2 [Mya arenaria]|uniref:uncharacterized protein LOC128211084 isoform X2 n=1 Tax=Mya arenaria TaxID=6604 RepID=UPI0022E75743|nr:uncharacterized protein LOC128211084 isoform X2 [Mya arenaria]
MSESTPGCQKKGVARADYSSQGDGQQIQSGILSPSPSLSGDRPTNKASGTIDEKKNIRPDNRLAVAPSASFVVQHRGQENAGTGEKGSQSVVREASDMHDDLTNPTAMQRKTGSSGNLHDDPSKQPGIKENTVTAEESVVELQQVNHRFYEREDVVKVEMHLWKVDKDSLVVNFCPYTVNVTFQTRDAQFLKLYKGSTEQTKFSWNIRLKGQAQEDKCLVEVYPSFVNLKITKKVSGCWGELENLKRTESVVELQHVHHTFTETDGMILVNMYVKEVDKDNLMVNFCPDTVHVKFRTRDAQFLKLCRGSTEQTKFSWTIRLKGRAQEDKCSFKVSLFAVSLNISKKVSGRWGDLENLKILEAVDKTPGNHDKKTPIPSPRLRKQQENGKPVKAIDNLKATNIQGTIHIGMGFLKALSHADTGNGRAGSQDQSPPGAALQSQTDRANAEKEGMHVGNPQASTPQSTLNTDEKRKYRVPGPLTPNQPGRQERRDNELKGTPSVGHEVSGVQHDTAVKQQKAEPSGDQNTDPTNQPGMGKVTRTNAGTNPASDLQATQQNSSGDEGNGNAKPRLDAKMTASSADSSTVDNKEAIHPQSSGDERNVDQRPHPKTTAESAYSLTKQPEMSLVADKEDTADVKDFLGSQDSISSIESFEILDPKEADCKEQENNDNTTQDKFPPDRTSFKCINSMQPRNKSEAAQVQEKPLSNNQFNIKVQGTLLIVQDKHNPRCKLALRGAKDAYFEGDLLCVDGRRFDLFVDENFLKCNEVQSLLGQETKIQVIEKRGNCSDMLKKDDHCSDFGSQSVKQKRNEHIIDHVPMIVVKIILQHSFKSELSTKFPCAEIKAENVNGNHTNIRIIGSWDCSQWFIKEIQYCLMYFNEVKNGGTIPKLPDIVENYLSNCYGKLGTVLWDIVPEKKQIFVWCSTTSPSAEEVVHTLKRAIRKVELSYDCDDSALATGREKMRKRFNVLHEELHWNAEGNHTLCMFCFKEEYEDIKKEMQNIFYYQRTTHEESGHSNDATVSDHRAHYSIVNGSGQTITVSNEEVVNLKADAFVVLKEKEIIGDSSKYDSNLPEKESMQDLQEKLNIGPSTIKLTGYNGKGRVRKRGNKSLPYTGEISPNCENELNDECSYNKTSNDDAIKAKHNASGSKTDLHNRNNTHPAADSEYESSSNVVSSGGASKKQAFQIKQDSSTVKPKSKSSCCDIQANSSERSRTNGTYTFSKEGGHWCIVDAKSEEMLTVLDFEADDIYFEGMKLVVVDDEYHTIKEDDGVVELRSVHKQSLISKNNDNLLHNTTKSFQCKSTQTIHADFDCEGIQKQDEAPPPLPPRNPIYTTVVESKAFGNPLSAYTQSPKITEKEASRSAHDSTRPSLIGRNKLRVQVLKDDIINVKADVIVNSTSVDLNLDRGHVSSQINKLAGTELQKAMYRKAKEINFWEYIVTSAFDLSNCKHIFHCALEPLNDNDGTNQEKSCLSKMRATVRLLLNEANRMSCNSIALPALGTGYLGYKPRDAATAIFLAVSDFVQFHGDRSHLEDITIVIYQTEENTFQAFKKVEAEMKPELATLTPRF